MKKFYLVILILISFLLYFSISIEAKAATGEWKLVVKIKGDVESQRADESQWNKIWQSRILKDGDKARTQDNSMAKIRLSDQSVVLIGSNTLVEVSEFKLTDNARTAKIKLILGKIRVKVGQFMGDSSKFEVTTPNAALAARGTEFYVDQEKVAKQDSAGATKIIVFDGDILVITKTGEFLLSAGQTAMVDMQGQFFLNPANFQYPKHISPPDQSDESLTNPSTSISDVVQPGDPMPPAVPIYNPSTPTTTPTPHVPYSY